MKEYNGVCVCVYKYHTVNNITVMFKLSVFNTFKFDGTLDFL